MKNFIETETIEMYPDKACICVDNIANIYPAERQVRTPKRINTHTCIDLKKPLYGTYDTLHCLGYYGNYKLQIEQAKDGYLTKKEGRLYFYFFLILFPFINVMVKIFVDIAWSIFK